MAYSKLVDVIVREKWTEDFIDASPILQNILASGLLVKDPRLDEVVNATDAGQTFELPFIADPVYSEPSIMDDSTNDITPSSIGWKTMYAMLGLYARSWKESSLIHALSQNNPVQFIRDNYVAKYWAEDLLYRTMKTVAGVAADNVANDNSDLVLDVSNDDDQGSSTDVLLDMSYTIDVAGKVGDKQDAFSFIFIHSKVYGDLKKANLIVTEFQSDGGMPIERYGKYRVFVNDLLPVAQGDNKKLYTSVISQNGALAYSTKKLPSDMPAVAIVKNELAGNGAGTSQFVTRRGLVVHPIGWSFDKSTVAGVSPSLAELENANAWDRKFQQKNSKFVFIITN